MVLSASCDRGAPPEQRWAMLDGVSAERIRSDMEVLAHDDMQGREAGTEGFLRAAGFVAARFAELGLEPLGDNGSYLQHVPFLETRLVPDSASLVLTRDGQTLSLRFRDDFVRGGSYGGTDETITAALVFVGYGIRAPQYAHDDFAGLDAGGSILVRLTGAPPAFATDERAYYSSTAVKNALAQELGATGVISIRTPVDQQRTPWQRVEAGIGSAGLRWLDANGRPAETWPGLVGEAVASETGARRLFEFASQDLDALFAFHDAGGRRSFALGVTATLAQRSEHRRVTSPNVLGLLRGTDPRLRHEYLLYTAHLDHLGIRPGTAGDGDDADVIWNGAYDNAAGVATMLEVAARMAEGRPRRSIIFAALTGEEKGLQGSSYLAGHLPVPVDRLVANINIDMPYLGFPLADVEGLGVEHSTLHRDLMAAAAELGLTLTPDPRPDLVRFIRSDQFSFVKQGVPGLNLKPGSLAGPGSMEGAAMLTEFLQNHYHQPSDDLSLPYSFDGSRRFAQAALLFGLRVSDADERPRWNEDDFFGERFGR